MHLDEFSNSTNASYSAFCLLVCASVQLSSGCNARLVNFTEIR